MLHIMQKLAIDLDGLPTEASLLALQRLADHQLGEIGPRANRGIIPRDHVLDMNSAPVRAQRAIEFILRRRVR